MLMTAWLKNEVYDAYHRPQIPEKNGERLPKYTFKYFVELLNGYGHEGTRRDLVFYDEVEYETEPRSGTAETAHSV